MTEQCGCFDDGYTDGINYCPLHAAAPLILEALQEVEYVRQGDDYIPGCPACGRAKYDYRGHKDDCKLNAAIKTATKGDENHSD